MRHRSIRGLSKTLLLFLITAAELVFAAPNTEESSSSQYIVTLKANVGGQSLQQIQSNLLANTSATMRSLLAKSVAISNNTLLSKQLNGLSQWQQAYVDKLQRTFVISDETGDLNALLKTLSSNAAVESIEPNYIVHVTANFNDPYLATSNSWGQGVADLWGLDVIEMDGLWSQSLGEGVTVAVIDTGVQYDHEDLYENVWTNTAEVPNNGQDDDGNGYVDDVVGWDFVNRDANPLDDHGHGTHVSGTIAAMANNGVGIVGVAPKAKVMCLKALSRYGSGTHADLAAAIIYAVNNGAKIINASWGGHHFSHTLNNAMRYAEESGVLVVAAAGNEGETADHHFPAAYDTVVSVGALATNLQLASYSNYGETLDVVAPGSGILSLRAQESAPVGGIAIGNYLVLNGTSMAAPHVAGLAALVKSLHPEYLPHQVRNLLRNTAVARGAGKWNEKFGYGQVYGGSLFSFENAVDVNQILPGRYQSSNKSYYFGSDTYSITGQLLGADLVGYSVSYAPLIDGVPGNYVNLTGGSQAGASGELMQFDTRNLADGQYIMQLKSTATNGKALSTYKRFIKDSSVKTGWPVASSKSHDLARTLYTEGSMTVADLDGDGVKEVITENFNQIFAWNAAGQLLPNFPITLPYPISAAVSVGDLDNDGDMELVVPVNLAAYAQAGLKLRPLYAYHHDGSLVEGFPSATLPTNMAEGTLLSTKAPFSAVIADVDQDGSNDIAVLIGSGSWKLPYVWLYVLEANGTPKAGWPRVLSFDRPTPFRSLTVGNVAGSDALEIVTTTETIYTESMPWTQDTKLEVFSANGDVLASRVFNGSTMNEGRVHNWIADLDGDGKNEIVAVTSVDRSGGMELKELQVLNGDLGSRLGWPQWVAGGDSLTLVDYDRDQLLDVVILQNTSQGAGFVAFGADGLSVSGNQVILQQSGEVSMWENHAVLTASLNGEPVFITGYHGLMDNGYAEEHYGFVAFNKFGEILPGWPKRIEGLAGAPALADLDDDGVLEVFGQTNLGWVHGFELDASMKQTEWHIEQLGGDVGRTNALPRPIVIEPPAPEPIPEDPSACVSFSGTLAEHVTAGRAYSRATGFWIWTVQTYYASGSDEQLGNQAATVMTLVESSPGVYRVGACDEPGSGTTPAQCITAKNADHIAAGRAYQCGTVWLPGACANGSDENLGLTGSWYGQSSSILEESAGYWVKVQACP